MVRLVPLVRLVHRVDEAASISEADTSTCEAATEPG